MHFVYKTDNLFQSIRISSGNSSVTKGFHFLKLICTADFLCVQNAPFKATSSFFNPFLLHLFFVLHLLIILSYKTLKLKSISNELWKGWKLAWYHHFIHILCAKSWEGYGKNWMHFVYKTDNLFRSIRVSYGNTSVTKGFHFLNLFELQTFSVFKMHHSKPHHQFSTLADFICSFSGIHSYFSAKWPWNWKALQMNSEKVESWHGVIISPT